MKTTLVLAFVLTLALLIGISPAPASASTGGCVTDPSVAPVGTLIGVTCDGLLPNTIANTYLVEPDGRAISGCEGYPVFSDPCNPKADSSGVVTFAIITGEPDFALGGIGTWQIVADNPGGASSTTSFVLTGTGVAVSGASLIATQLDNRTYSFTGSGFAPFEVVSFWADHPAGCSGTSGSIVAHFPDGDVDAISSAAQGSFPADASGTITVVKSFPSVACPGMWQMAARGNTSGLGASVQFLVSGSPVTADGVSAISVLTSGASTLVPLVTVSGTGFPGGAGVNCWVTRPDGRAFPFDNAVADAAGSFSATQYAEDVDAAEPNEAFSESAEPGEWAMTCATPNHSSLATASFTLSALPVDP